MFDFDLANSMDEYIEIKVKPTDELSWSVGNHKSGWTLAMFYVYSYSREANERRAKEIRKSLVLRQSMLPKKSSVLFMFFGVAVSFLSGPPSVQSASTPTSRDFFEQKIRPILAQDCYECHQSSGPRKGGLALDDRQGLLKGGY